MVWVAVAEAAAIVAIVAILGRLLSSQQRAHARREDLLVNQLLAATGHAWQPPPAEEAIRKARSDRVERPSFVAAPEQQPLE